MENPALIVNGMGIFMVFIKTLFTSLVQDIGQINLMHALKGCPMEHLIILQF